jgi:hypothetical protein
MEHLQVSAWMVGQPSTISRSFLLKNVTDGSDGRGLGEGEKSLASIHV